MKIRMTEVRISDFLLYMYLSRHLVCRARPSVSGDCFHGLLRVLFTDVVQISQSYSNVRLWFSLIWASSGAVVYKMHA